MTIPTITKSRMRLRKFDFWENPEGDGEFFFISPTEVYPALFSLRFPLLVNKSRHRKWNLASHGKSSFLSFGANVLSDVDIESVTEWANRYRQYVLLGRNEYLRSVFSNELDFCLALDYNYDKIIERRTVYGEAEFQLKYRSNIQFLDILSGGISLAFCEILKTFNIEDSIVSIIPAPLNRCSVPRKLAKSVSSMVDSTFIDGVLHCGKQSLKNLSLDDKVKEWERLYSCADCVEFSSSVLGKTVFLIDDLYQSGTTLWSCAKYLKSIGATAVIGLICVKSLRDTDNQ
jgi:predicted amidophosphoribosyltransferase